MDDARRRAAEALGMVAAEAPELLAAAADVDRTLLAWSLSLGLRERLQACSNATRALARFRRVPPGDR
jgi:hypothetical protein